MPKHLDTGPTIQSGGTMDDSEATISDAKALVEGFCAEREWDRFHNPKDLAIGISIEASELLQIFRFKDADESEAMMSSPGTRAEVEQELADVLYFVLRFSQMNGIDLYSALEGKIRLNGERYPVEKSRGSNRKYDEPRSGLHGGSR